MTLDPACRDTSGITRWLLEILKAFRDRDLRIEMAICIEWCGHFGEAASSFDSDYFDAAINQFDFVKTTANDLIEKVELRLRDLRVAGPVGKLP